MQRALYMNGMVSQWSNSGLVLPPSLRQMLSTIGVHSRPTLGSRRPSFALPLVALGRRLNHYVIPQRNQRILSAVIYADMLAE